MYTQYTHTQTLKSPNYNSKKNTLFLFEGGKKTSTSTSRGAVLAEQRLHLAMALALSIGQRCVTVLQEGGVSIHVRVRV